jgi:hypothetical protein
MLTISHAVDECQGLAPPPQSVVGGRAVQTLCPTRAGTARLVRSQKVEIKYKKPTSLIATLRLAAPPINCGGGESKMIRGDSLSRIFPCPGRPYPACRSARWRSAEHCGGAATNLNRFESLQRNPDRCSRTRQAPQGGGGYKSLQLLGRVTARGSRADFLWPPKLLNYFLEIKEFKRCAGRGEVKSPGLLGVDRAGGPRESPRNSELFFSSRRQLRNACARFCSAAQTRRRGIRWLRSTQKNAAKFRVGGVAGCLPSR